MIPIFQIIVIPFALFALSRVMLRFKSGQITLGMMIFWSFVWCSAMAAALFPRIVEPFAIFFGTRAADLVIFAGLIGSYYLMFRLYVKIEKIEHDITLIVRKIAIYEVRK